MIEYYIIHPATIEFVKDLWERFFKEDQKWHFTLEGHYVEVRVEKDVPGLEAYLNESKIEFRKFPYIDENLPVEKYQPQFEKIFHGLAELSMLVDREEQSLESVIERCVHLVFNIFGLNWKKEADFLGDYMPDRAYMAGEAAGYWRAKKEKESE